MGSGKIKGLMEEEGVVVTIADQCQYGLTTWGKKGEAMPAKKKTTFMTNSQAIAAELKRVCDGKHEHQQLLSGRAAEAARYPKGLCEAICKRVARRGQAG